MPEYITKPDRYSSRYGRLSIDKAGVGRYIVCIINFECSQGGETFMRLSNRIEFGWLQIDIA